MPCNSVHCFCALRAELISWDRDWMARQHLKYSALGPSQRTFADNLHKCMPLLCTGNWIRDEKRKENIFKVHSFISSFTRSGLVCSESLCCASWIPGGRTLLTHSSGEANTLMRGLIMFLTNASWWAPLFWAWKDSKEDVSALLVSENQGPWKRQSLSCWKNPDQMLLDIKCALLKALTEDLIHSLIKIW